MVYILDEIVTKSSLYEEVSRRKSYSVVLSQRGCVNRKSSGVAERSDRRVFSCPISRTNRFAQKNTLHREECLKNVSIAFIRIARFPSTCNQYAKVLIISLLRALFHESEDLHKPIVAIIAVADQVLAGVGMDDVLFLRTDVVVNMLSS